MLINRRIKQFYALCLLLLLLGLAVAYRNGSFLHPKYDFLYWTIDGACTGEYFSVANEKVTKNELDCIFDEGNVRLYRHDVRHDQSREINIEEAMKYRVTNPIPVKYDFKASYQTTSPDGYRVEYDRIYTPMTIFWYLLGGDKKMYENNYEHIDLVKGFAKRSLNIRQGSNPSWTNFTFLTWVISSEQK